MNYQRIYDQIIERAVSRESLGGYSENHHIIPKSLGGTNEKSNLVRLTAREHYLAHCLLACIYGGTQWYPIRMMKGANRSSRMYAKAKEEFRLSMLGNTPTNKGRKWTAEQKAKLPNRNGECNPFYGKKHTDQMKNLSRKANWGNRNSAGRIVTTEQRRQASKRTQIQMTGNTHALGNKNGKMSDEHKRNLGMSIRRSNILKKTAHFFEI